MGSANKYDPWWKSYIIRYILPRAHCCLTIYFWYLILPLYLLSKHRLGLQNRFERNEMLPFSKVTGPTSEPLWTTTLGALVETQARHYGKRTAVVFPAQSAALTYDDLYARSTLVAKALLESGLQHGDKVGISAGNCVEYIEVFLGAARIGCPVVVLNSTYTAAELLRAVTFSSECEYNAR